MKFQRLAIIVLVSLLPFWGWKLYRQFSPDNEGRSAGKVRLNSPLTQKTGQVHLNPETKGNAVDLCQGYLFNSQRFVPSSSGIVDQSKKSINMETLQYDGSVIIDETRKAIISFAVADSGVRQKKNKNVHVRSAHRRQIRRQSKVVAAGDIVAGYTARVVEPLYIVFTRGDKEIRRDLFDKGKQRKAGVAVSLKKVRPQSPKRRTVKKPKKNIVRNPVPMEML